MSSERIMSGSLSLFGRANEGMSISSVHEKVLNSLSRLRQNIVTAEAFKPSPLNHLAIDTIDQCCDRIEAIISSPQSTLNSQKF